MFIAGAALPARPISFRRVPGARRDRQAGRHHCRRSKRCLSVRCSCIKAFNSAARAICVRKACVCPIRRRMSVCGVVCLSPIACSHLPGHRGGIPWCLLATAWHRAAGRWGRGLVFIWHYHARGARPLIGNHGRQVATQATQATGPPGDLRQSRRPERLRRYWRPTGDVSICDAGHPANTADRYKPAGQSANTTHATQATRADQATSDQIDPRSWQRGPGQAGDPQATHGIPRGRKRH